MTAKKKRKIEKESEGTLRDKLRKLKPDELAPITVRLDREQLEFLATIEEATGVHYYEYIRALISALRNEFQHGQRIELPFQIITAAEREILQPVAPDGTAPAKRKARRRPRIF